MERPRAFGARAFSLESQLWTTQRSSLLLHVVDLDESYAGNSILSRMAVNCPGGRVVKMPDSFGSDSWSPLAAGCAQRSASGCCYLLTGRTLTRALGGLLFRGEDRRRKTET